MPYAVELYFDAAVDARIRALWEELALVGASSMRDSGARPHVSLAVCEAVDVEAARRLLDRFGAETPTFSMELSSLGLFATANPVVFLAPKVTRELLSLHASFFAEFEGMARQCWPHYSPSQWVPHCTLASGSQGQWVGAASEICRAAGLPLACTVCEVGLVEFPPIRQLHGAALAKAHGTS